MSACRSCGATVVWARMATSGKLSPFQPDEAGEWVIVDEVASHQGKVPEGLDAAAPRYMSHFATCPHHGMWRKRK